VARGGDLTGDGKVTVADVDFLIAVLFGSATSANADINGDGNVTCADVTALTTLLVQ